MYVCTVPTLLYATLLHPFHYSTVHVLVHFFNLFSAFLPVLYTFILHDLSETSTEGTI